MAPAEMSAWLHERVIVEEKLDGANVRIWLEPQRGIQVASRGGAGARDRAGQLGRLRAWASEREPELRELLDDDWALYGEWLWLKHGVAYDKLPDLLVVLDLWRPLDGFCDLSTRDTRAITSGFVVPPRVFEGALGSADRLRAMFGPSAFATSSRREGLVLRARDGRRCKVVDSAYERRSDAAWSIRTYNRLGADIPSDNAPG